MENENIVTIQFKFTRTKALLLLALFFLSWHPKLLNSETLTLTTYYPAPYGGYVSLLTTGSGGVNTLLARDGGNVLIGESTQASPTQKLDVNGGVRATGEIAGTLSGYGQFRAIAGNYGAFTRNDGSDTYMPLITNAGDQYGIWNGLRPLRVNNATGDVYLANSQISMRHSDGALIFSLPSGSPGVSGLCRTVGYSYPGIAFCGANERVMAEYGTGNCFAGLLFMGGNVNDGSRWIPHYEQGCSGTMVCCKIAAP